ncbi:ABC transporter ATP-binding protein [Bacillus sp. 31A1R]|uniref:ABC transporter ATP-binding protein n=1 Tax=Robertmurraya mangrovi TaxID=3098077 RepID=A0ABU5IYS3_9BACI|nr:ABC transporter ATP-binding protein [Bacillus sp. 31A1R]MDZ5472319.1 ABC transporter ATP-binding protein [Bacillus sp. 31A1R]
MPILQVKNLNVTYQTKNKQITAVNKVNFSINEQDSIGIVGESGSGKSTLAMAILRLLPNRIATVEGEVYLNGKDFLKLSDEELTKKRWKEIAVVFQKAMNALSPVHKIGSQMVDIFQIHDKQLSKKEIKNRMIDLLEMVNLPPRVYNLYPFELSGGMLQRVSIAISLMHNPKLLILDEATTALDVVTQGQILENIMELEKNFNTTRMMITHDMSVVASSCKKVVVMYGGHILESGLVKDVLKNPKHPYTKGLLESLPSFTGEKNNIRGIPGSLPDLSSPMKGCVFANRCEHVMDICREKLPSEVALPGEHKISCHLIGGELDD